MENVPKQPVRLKIRLLKLVFKIIVARVKTEVNFVLWREIVVPLGIDVVKLVMHVGGIGGKSQQVLLLAEKLNPRVEVRESSSK